MTTAWWKRGVIYQIYPRSFQDSNDDGVGDLEGIRRRLDHLAWLGVDALWLSPTFPSPMADFGYDVSDYCDVDPLFGSLDDMDRLVEAAHERGLRVLLDWVPSHTSDRHRWFLESRSSRDADKRGWYFWRDPAPGGGPPNNWISIFGGPAWELDPATGQYYLHSFLKEQPDLDWRNPEVVEAMHGVLRFWLERGIDGFRIDVIHRIGKHPELADNPPAPGVTGGGYGGQLHLHDENDPHVHELLRGIRGVLDAYSAPGAERMAVGEVYLLDPEEVARYHGRGDELHLAFNFPFLHSPWSASAFGEQVETMEELLRDVPDGWPTWTLSNHDHSRHASRYRDAKRPESDDRRARLAATLLLTLRGTPFLYYGEEIGMRDVPIPRARLQDPLAVTLHPNLSRDPERTPMPWDASRHAGFTASEPWLPLGADSATRNVDAQRAEPGSLLHYYRALLALRRESPALHAGALRLLPAPDGALAYERLDAETGARAFVALNFGDAELEVELPGGRVVGGLSSDPARPPEALGGRVRLGADAAVVLVVAG